jgi:hypothetical protein
MPKGAAGEDVLASAIEHLEEKYVLLAPTI